MDITCVITEGWDFPNFAKNPHMEIKWRCDLSQNRAREMVATFAVPEVTSDYMEIINDPEVDRIKVSTSHEVYLPIIEAAAL